jgi:hypothetical protein
MINVIVLWQTVYIQAAFDHLAANGHPIDPADVARLTPLGHPTITSKAATAPPAAHPSPDSGRCAPSDSGSCTNPRHRPICHGVPVGAAACRLGARQLRRPGQVFWRATLCRGVPWGCAAARSDPPGVLLACGPRDARDRGFILSPGFTGRAVAVRDIWRPGLVRVQLTLPGSPGCDSCADRRPDISFIDNIDNR